MHSGERVLTALTRRRSIALVAARGAVLVCAAVFVVAALGVAAVAGYAVGSGYPEILPKYGPRYAIGWALFCPVIVLLTSAVGLVLASGALTTRAALGAGFFWLFLVLFNWAIASFAVGGALQERMNLEHVMPLGAILLIFVQSGCLSALAFLAGMGSDDEHVIAPDRREAHVAPDVPPHSEAPVIQPPIPGSLEELVRSHERYDRSRNERERWPLVLRKYSSAADQPEAGVAPDVPPHCEAPVIQPPIPESPEELLHLSERYDYPGLRRERDGWLVGGQRAFANVLDCSLSTTNKRLRKASKEGRIVLAVTERQTRIRLPTRESS